MSSPYIYSTVLIIPTALKTQADLVGEALGWGEGSYSVALTDNIALSHYGCHTSATQALTDMLTSAGGGSLPAVTWGDFGLKRNDVFSVVSALIVSMIPIRTITPKEHFNSVLVSNSLVRIDEMI